MSDRVELFLYHALANTGTIEFSTVSAAGPWTAVTLSAPKCVLDAFLDWETQINAAISPQSVDFNWDSNGGVVEFTSTTASCWVRLSATQAALFGFASTVITDGDSSGLTPRGIAQLVAGRTQPMTVEQANLAEVRGGRATTYHYGRAIEVKVDFAVSPTLWAGLENAPIVSGLGRFRVTGSNVDPFGEADLDGYLDADPLETTDLQHESPDDAVFVEFRCAMEDPA